MKRSPALSPQELTLALEKLPRWSGDESGLQRNLRFATFAGAIRFMSACVEGIDQRDHHPVWTNKHAQLEINLSTFDAGGKVTQKDVDLAHHMESLLATRGAEFDHGSQS